MSYKQGVADSNRRRTKHGQASRDRGTTKVYDAWTSMKHRCTNPNHVSWARYGGRGITMCKEWQDSFERFYADVGEPPTAAHTIDRIDNDKGYEPGNVRWATRKEQSNNISTNVWVEHQGKRMTWAQWAEYLDVPYNLLATRVKKRLPIEQILQPRINAKRNSLIEINGRAMSLREWAAESGVKYQTLYARMKAGKPIL